MIGGYRLPLGKGHDSTINAVGGLTAGQKKCAY